MQFNDLIPSKYKNLRLLVRKESFTYGLQKQENLSPNLVNVRTLTNLTQVPEKITLDVVFTGATANFDSQRLLKIASEKTAGRLIVPTFGLLDKMAIAEPPVLNTDMTKIGVITTSITFLKVIDDAPVSNLFAKLEEGLQALNDALYALNEALYIFTEIQDAINSVQAGINGALNGLNSGILAVTSLQNAFKLNDFLKGVQSKLSAIERNLLKGAILDISKSSVKSSSNPILQAKRKSLSVALTTTKLAIATVYLEKISNTSQYTSQEEITEELNFLTSLTNDLITEDILTKEITDLIKINTEFVINILNDTFELLPEIYTINVTNESSLLIAYRTTGNIDNAKIIEDLNPQLENICNITGEVKCLRLL